MEATTTTNNHMNHEEIKNAEKQFDELLRQAMQIAGDISESAGDLEFDARYDLGIAYDKGVKDEVGRKAHEGRRFIEIKTRYDMAVAMLSSLRK